MAVNAAGDAGGDSSGNGNNGVDGSRVEDNDNGGSCGGVTIYLEITLICIPLNLVTNESY